MINKDTKIKSSVVNEALLEVKAITEAIEQNTTKMAKDIVEESFQKALKKVINEDINDFDEEEVEDVDSTEKEETGEEQEITSDNEGSEEETTETESEESNENIIDDLESDSEGVENFSIGDNTYDLSNAQEDDIVSVFKKLNNDDEVVVVDCENGDIQIKDNETGAEYMIKNSNKSATIESEDFDDVNLEDEDEYEFNTKNEDENDFNLEEEIISEYDANLGYTNNYQNKTAMTTPGMNEPANKKSTNDWDKGLPNGGDSQRPYGGTVKANVTPFEKTVNEEEQIIDEAGLTRTKANLRQRTGVKSEPQIEHTDKIRVDGVRDGAKLATEMVNKVNNLLKQVSLIEGENKQLKKLMNVVTESLRQANLTNQKMGKFINLVFENATTQQEKDSIIKRIDEGKTSSEVEIIYESIDKELKKRPTPENTLSENVNNSGKLLNEKTIYVNKEFNPVHDLMARLDKFDTKKNK